VSPVADGDGGRGMPQHEARRAPSTRPTAMSVVRRLDATGVPDVSDWIHKGVGLVRTFPGFVGAGWVRAPDGSGEWQMVCGFESADALTHWESSPERERWLGDAGGRLETVRTDRLTGLEGWFDPARPATAGGRPPAPPPRWKQSVTIWLVFFPLNLLATVTLGTALAHWPVVPRVAVITLALTPVMTYLLLPWITRRLGRWLHGGSRTSRRA